MAAYAALLSLTQTLEKMLNADEHRCPIFNQTEQEKLSSLHGKLNFLLSFLEEDFVEKNSEALRCFEGRIRDATCDAEDVIESHVRLESASCEDRIETHVSNQVLLKFKQKYGGLEKIIEEIGTISTEVEKIKERNHIEDFPRSNQLPAVSSKFGSNKECVMVGFEEELLEIKDRLTGSPSKLKIISIVGMGGIGKTTLAKNAFEDPLTIYHFHIRAWITASQKYHVPEILEGLLHCTRNLSRQLSYQEDTEKLGEHLYKSLKGKRYLIVMDDVWDTKVWDEVKRFFPNDENGSRIILTTRLSNIAVYADPYSPTFHLSLLSPEESWKVLRQKAFGEESSWHLELEEIGKEIAKNCKGLQLALAVIGGLLYKGEKTLAYWKQVEKNINSIVTSADDQFMDILSLSYNDLPHHLRPCFLYMGCFPEDHNIKASKLIKLWIADGFVKPNKSKSMEEVAHTYLEDLIGRNMILAHERNFIGEIRTCGIHDLMRDLCLRKAHEEKFLQVVDRLLKTSPECINNQRRVCLVSGFNDRLADFYASPVRSLLHFNSKFVRSQYSLFTLPLLKVLHAIELWLSEFPIELVNLKYIALINIEINKLPAKISNLQNLQTLIIETSVTVNLPSEIWMMPQLRHILIKKCFLPHPSAAQMEKKFIPLGNLQTLARVRNFKLTKEVLQMMPNLKKLAIKFSCESHTQLSSYFIDNIIHFHQLEYLKLFFMDKYDLRYHDPLPENLYLGTRLTRLTVCRCGLSSKNMAVLGSLPNLQVLKLKQTVFDSNLWEPREGEFRKLKFLLLWWANLKHWKADETHFPNLQRLSLEYCFELVEIPSGIGDIPTLQEIRLFRCPSARSSAQSIQKEQENQGNYDLQIIYDCDEELKYEV